MTDGLDLLIKAETQGLDDWDEAVELADFVYLTGLHLSQGSYQRFLEDMAESGWSPAGEEDQ